MSAVVEANVQQINALFEKLKEKLSPSSDLMGAIAGRLHASVSANFENEGAEVPGGWSALKAATIKAKDKRNQSRKILEAVGNLQKTIQQGNTANEAWVSSNLKYARIHHFGGEIFHHPRTRHLAFRTNRKGDQYLKQKSNSNLVVFAKKSHKDALRYTIAQKSYLVKIPARPFMVLTNTYKENILNIIKQSVKL